MNGQLVAAHLSGYTSYFVNVGAGTATNATLSFGDKPNVIAVFTDATQPEGWWYDGGGIYRHVHLWAADPLHIVPWSLYAPATIDMTTLVRPASGPATADGTVEAELVVENLRSTSVHGVVVEFNVQCNKRQRKKKRRRRKRRKKEEKKRRKKEKNWRELIMDKRKSK